MAGIHFAVFAASCALLAATVSPLPPAVFVVGEERGWAVPPAGNGTESYNHWAKRSRLHVGDILYFKYGNDSVLLVTHDDYKQCSTETPVGRFTGGDTKFRLDRYGAFYFLSGVPGHCERGQRMIARVGAPSALTGGAAPAPAHAPGMPPTAVAARAPAPSPRPAASSPAAAAVPPVPSSSGSGSVSKPAAPSPGPGPSPSPLPQASGASRRATGAASPAVVRLVVAGVIAIMSLVVV